MARTKTNVDKYYLMEHRKREAIKDKREEQEKQHRASLHERYGETLPKARIIHTSPRRKEAVNTIPAQIAEGISEPRSWHDPSSEAGPSVVSQQKRPYRESREVQVTRSSASPLTVLDTVGARRVIRQDEEDETMENCEDSDNPNSDKDYDDRENEDEDEDEGEYGIAEDIVMDEVSPEFDTAQSLLNELPSIVAQVEQLESAGTKEEFDRVLFQAQTKLDELNSHFHKLQELRSRPAATESLERNMTEVLASPTVPQPIEDQKARSPTLTRTRTTKLRGTETNTSLLAGLKRFEIVEPETEEPETVGSLWTRTPHPAVTIPTFRPVSHPFICQREHAGDGLPCPYQRECSICSSGMNCGAGRDGCATQLNNNHVAGGFLGPDIDIKSPHGTMVKKTRSSVKDYFGRNKKESNYIAFDDTRVCRKCYQNMAYQRQEDVPLKWPRLKSEMLHVVVDNVEQQQIERTGRPGVWEIQLKKGEKERLINHGREDMGSSQLEGSPKQGRTTRNNGKGKKTDRNVTEGTYEAPIAILQEMQRRFCGTQKTVADCHAINEWCRSKLESGEVIDLPIWEHIPQWHGDPSFSVSKNNRRFRNLKTGSALDKLKQQMMVGSVMNANTEQKIAATSPAGPSRSPMQPNTENGALSTPRAPTRRSSRLTGNRLVRPPRALFSPIEDEDAYWNARRITAPSTRMNLEPPQHPREPMPSASEDAPPTKRLKLNTKTTDENSKR